MEVRRIVCLWGGLEGNWRGKEFGDVDRWAEMGPRFSVGLCFKLQALEVYVHGCQSSDLLQPWNIFIACYLYFTDSLGLNG